MIIQRVPDIAKHIILVVDDDEAVRDSLRKMMESEGFEVRAFSNGQTCSTKRACLRLGAWSLITICPQ
jgi:FixJ family two-component response regulator